MKKEALINFRAEEELKESFKEVAVKEGYNISSVLVASMKDIVKRGKIPLNLKPYLNSNANKAITLPYIKKCLMEVLDNYGKDNVDKVCLFGSFARGEESISSDIDLYIEVKEGFSLFDMVNIEEGLEESMHKRFPVCDDH